LEHEPTGKLSFEDLARSLGIGDVYIMDPSADPAGLMRLLQDCLSNKKLNVIIARRPCLLIAGKIKEYDRAASQTCTEALAEES
jgi:indolepyruvate ferredoxin oxidoreductase alpha subunit